MKRQNYLLTLILILSLTLLSSCGVKAKDPRDPLESVNRAIFTVNRVLDDYFLKQIARVYSTLLPEVMQKGFSNAYSNINNVTTMANYILQGNPYRFLETTWRLLINTTVGLGGVIDVAAKTGLEPHPTDMGVTFGKWGWENSTFLVLPLFGPTTLRDGLGFSIDYSFLSPYGYFEPKHVRRYIYAGQLLVWRAELLDLETFIERAAIDRYTFERDAYLQRRAFLIDEQQKHDDDPYLEEDDLYV